MKYFDPKRLLLATIAFVVIVTVFVGVGVWRLREDTIASALRETEDLATILADEVDHSTRAIEIVLDEVIETVRQRDYESNETYLSRLKSREQFDYLQDRLSRLPQADLAAIVGVDGRLLNLTRTWPAADVDLSDRDYFEYLKSHRNSSMYVSEPTLGRISGVWTIYFAKRLEAQDGRFAGIVYIGVRPEYFIRTIDVVSSIPDRTMLLARKDGVVLLRSPDTVVRSGFRIPRHSPWYDLVETGGQYFSEGMFEQKSRWISVRPVQKLPLVVDVGVSQRQVLASWLVRAIIIGCCGLVVDALFILLMFALYRQFELLRRSEDALSSKTDHIQQVNHRFNAALSNTTHGIAMFDSTGQPLIKNEKYERILGFHTIEFVLDDHQAMSDTADLKAGAEVPFCVYDGDLVIKLKTGGSQSDVVSLDDGSSIRITLEAMSEGGWVTTLEDVTEAERANEEIVRMAHYDGLTKIANRTKFQSALNEALTPATQGAVGVMLLDLDHFKEVNDTHGHGIGDALLQHVAQRLVACVRTEDLVARLGGDEFAILCDLSNDETRDLSRLAQLLLGAIGANFVIQGADITIGLSIGIAVGQSSTHAFEKLMRHADLALYEAKSEGRNCYRFFETHMEDRFNQRKALTADLEQAIKNDELAVYYQPIVDAQTLQIRSMEALVRWNHSTRGMVSPADFVPIAEEFGLIYPLGELVLRRACLDAVKWPDDVRVAVNVSTMQLIKPNFSQIATAILTETRLNPNRLKLEITESVLLSETTHGLANLSTLRALGVSISLDDFGTGYSSLSYLKRFHFDEIKIDKSFVDDLGIHRGSTAIVAATITLARELDIVTTAEGVENEDQLLLLQASGVQQMQGYLFGKPAPASSWTYDVLAGHDTGTPMAALRRA